MRIGCILPLAKYLKRVDVPKRGLEPPRIAPHAPEACVYTNFTT